MQRCYDHMWDAELHFYFNESNIKYFNSKITAKAIHPHQALFPTSKRDILSFSPLYQLLSHPSTSIPSNLYLILLPFFFSPDPLSFSLSIRSPLSAHLFFSAVSHPSAPPLSRRFRRILLLLPHARRDEKSWFVPCSGSLLDVRCCCQRRSREPVTMAGGSKWWNRKHNYAQQPLGSSSLSAGPSFQRARAWEVGSRWQDGSAAGESSIPGRSVLRPRHGDYGE